MTSGPQTSSSPSNDASFGNQMPIEQNGVSSESIQRRSMVPNISEEVSNSVEKDGISYVLEARSLSAVVRYVYTPLEGNLSDIEVEINNADAIKFQLYSAEGLYSKYHPGLEDGKKIVKINYIFLIRNLPFNN